MNSMEFQTLQSDLGDIRSSMKQVAEAMTRLAVLEERHSVTALLANRLVAKIEAIEISTASITTDIAVFKAQINAANKGVSIAWTVLGSGILLICGRLIQMAL